MALYEGRYWPLLKKASKTEPERKIGIVFHNDETHDMVFLVDKEFDSSKVGGWAKKGRLIVKADDLSNPKFKK